MGGRFVDQRLFCPGDRDQFLLFQEHAQARQLGASAGNRTTVRFLVLHCLHALLNAFPRRKLRASLVQGPQITLQVPFARGFEFRERNFHALIGLQHFEEPLLAQREIIVRGFTQSFEPFDGLSYRFDRCGICRCKLRLQRFVFYA